MVELVTRRQDLLRRTRRRSTAFDPGGLSNRLLFARTRTLKNEDLAEMPKGVGTNLPDLRRLVSCVRDDSLGYALFVSALALLVHGPPVAVGIIAIASLALFCSLYRFIRARAR